MSEIEALKAKFTEVIDGLVRRAEHAEALNRAVHVLDGVEAGPATDDSGVRLSVKSVGGDHRITRFLFPAEATQLAVALLNYAEAARNGR